MRCLLVEDEGRLILIDTGMGNKQDESFLVIIICMEMLRLIHHWPNLVFTG